jgi:hypothetical protein
VLSRLPDHHLLEDSTDGLLADLKQSLASTRDR